MTPNGLELKMTQIRDAEKRRQFKLTNNKKWPKWKMANNIISPKQKRIKIKNDQILKMAQNG